MDMPPQHGAQLAAAADQQRAAEHQQVTLPPRPDLQANDPGTQPLTAEALAKLQAASMDEELVKLGWGVTATVLRRKQLPPNRQT